FRRRRLPPPLDRRPRLRPRRGRPARRLRVVVRRAGLRRVGRQAAPDDGGVGVRRRRQRDAHRRPRRGGLQAPPPRLVQPPPPGRPPRRPLHLPQRVGRLGPPRPRVGVGRGLQLRPRHRRLPHQQRRRRRPLLQRRQRGRRRLRGL